MTRLRPLWPYGVLLLFALLAAEPLAREQMTCSDDGPFHLHRAVQLEWLLQAGHWLPRWAPHMAQGYGYPFFIFSPSLSAYFVVGLHAFGFELPGALHLAFGITIWLAGCAAFLFARAVWGERAGVVAGVAYSFAPYLAFDILYRANFAESFAFIWPPLVLWGLHRMKAEDGRLQLRNIIVPALAFAAMSLSHNALALITTPLLIGYVGVNAWRGRSWRLGGLGVVALLLGASATAYYWFPALAEQALVHSERLAVPPDFTWYTNFIDLNELLATPRAEDPLLINPSPPKALGLTAALLCLPALGGLLVGRPTRRWETGYFLLAVLGYGCLTLSFSAPLWGLLSPLQVVQFPWRMLGPAALCAALTIGAGVHSLERIPVLGRWPAVVAVTLFIFGNWSAWYPRYCATPESITLAEMVAYESATNTIGLTAKGEFLPLTVEYLPEDQSLAEAILRGEEPARLHVIDGDAQFETASAPDPLDATFSVVAHTPATLVYRQFLYPGWQVTANVQPVELRPAEGTGLITFDLPAGTHALHIVFGSTPLRTVASLVSVVALFVLGAIFIVNRPASASRPSSAAPMWDLGVLALVLLVLKLTVIDRVPNPLRQTRFDAENVAGMQTPLRADFAGGLGMYGYDIATRTLPGDGSVDVALYVGKREPNIREFTPVFVLHDAQGLNWIGADASLPPRWHRAPPPSYNWPDDAYAQWARRVTALPGTPPGDYELKLELIDLSTGAMQSMLDEQGNAIQPRVSFGSVRVTRPAHPFALQPEFIVNGAFGPATLLGYNLDRREANAGDTLALTLYWRSERLMTQDMTARLRVGEFDMVLPLVNGYGTREWQVGDEWRGQHRVTLPAALASGAYPLQLEMDGQPGGYSLGTLIVNAPLRVFEPPAFEYANGTAFDGVGELAGYTLTREGQRVNVRLVWKATTTPALRYSVFVHLGDASRVWAQSDSTPAGGARPTTGWLAGEYIVDEHTLAFALPDELPAGDYALYVGMYDPQSGVRVSIKSGNGDNRAPIATLTWP
ncbi:MAG: hypothetical protein ACT4QE_07395 [Anaerolineales bacterium]